MIGHLAPSHNKIEQKDTLGVNIKENNSNESIDILDFYAVDTTNNCTEVTAKIKFKILYKENIPAKLSVKEDSGSEGNMLPGYSI